MRKIFVLFVFLFFITSNASNAGQVNCSKFNMFPIVYEGVSLQWDYKGSKATFKGENNKVNVYQNGKLVASFETVGKSMKKMNCYEY